MTPILEGKISPQLPLYLDVIGGPGLNMGGLILFQCNFLFLHQSHMSPLCAVLTFKSVQTADEKVDELWQFDLFVSGVGIELFSLS